MDPADLFRIVDVIGVIANALLGSALARAMGFDIIGFFVLGTGTALGGGMIRDMLLGVGFPVALTDPWYLGGAFAASLIAYFIAFEGRWSQRMLSLADVLVLGCWSATGASKGLSAGLGWIPSIFLGVVTATMGGLLRDVMVNRIPSIFGGSPLYATFSVIAATQMVIFQSNGMYELGMGSSIIMCGVFGLLARHFNWQLPQTAYDIREYSKKLRRIHINRRKFGPATGDDVPNELTSSNALHPDSEGDNSVGIAKASRQFRRNNRRTGKRPPRGLRSEE